VAPFVAGYASLVVVLGSSVRHLRQRNKNKNWCTRQEAQTRPDRRRDVLLIEPDQSSDSLREWNRARSALEVLVTLLRR
jgi:hypothetical protein